VHENIIEDAEYAPSIEFGGSNTGEMSALSVQVRLFEGEISISIHIVEYIAKGSKECKGSIIESVKG